MKLYQNSKIIATLEKIGACLGENKKTHKIEMLGNLWELKDDRNNLIDNLILDFEVKVFNAEMLMVVCKKFKRKLALSDEEVEIIADNQEELEQQRIVLDIKG
ncbi:hypothetical protein [Helicobacter ganmani]|uniref:hypothetical protein n=1 Tax=Helicobacter ganmani TaxID=60246 RepID=UPI003A8880F7